MSRVTKRKHVMKEMLADDFEHPTTDQQIARILASRGNNLHEVEPADTIESFLVSMPTKFRKNVWIKRGDFVVVQSIDEGDKVKAEIVRILTPQHIKEFTKDGVWPEKFAKKEISPPPAMVSNDSTANVRNESDASSDDDDDDDDLVQNTNRRQFAEESSSSEDDDEDTDSNDDNSGRN